MPDEEQNKIKHISEKYIWNKPNNLSFIEAAAIGLIFGTTYVCLMDRARIKKNDGMDNMISTRRIMTESTQPR